MEQTVIMQESEKYEEENRHTYVNVIRYTIKYNIEHDICIRSVIMTHGRHVLDPHTEKTSIRLGRIPG